jgi:putative oxidoreductase
MTRDDRVAAPGPGVVVGTIEQANRLLGRLAHPTLSQLFLRLGLAIPFWRSGVRKWDGVLQLNDGAVFLFASEFKLHLPGGPYAFPAPEAVAWASASAEIVLPVLLVLGLASRLSAFCLLVMTLVIQLTVPDGWPIHVTWAAMALAIMTWGPGAISVDRLIRGAVAGSGAALDTADAAPRSRVR